MKRRGAVLLAVSGVLCAGAAAACAGPGLGLGEEATCISWVFFDSPAKAAEDAAVVVRATVVESAGTVALWGTRANVWRLDVEEVLAGSMRGVAAGEEFEVVSTPRTCDAGGEYPGGDRLDTDEPVVVLIDEDEMFDVVRTLTPYDGVVAPAPDGGLPTAWPEDQHDL
jgi:hypothetical protein